MTSISHTATMAALFSLLNGSTAFASYPALECKTDVSGPRSAYDMRLKVSARMIVASKDQSGATQLNLRDVVVDATNKRHDQKLEIETGRRDYIESDSSYKPRKYKNMVRFDLTELTDTKSFSSYAPGDECSIKLMVPADAIQLVNFKAAAVINCDQSGGSQTLSCVAK